ncbi:hypothetical protein PVAP13_5NG618601 [Panicum virgatum]|uniref:Uncharacterized protein n=1 Tax=Panicum virgatum TaxID=38727 RepID=A0A8T0SAC1_PANVG|nr:hypothetical protein PVAP13_5NG618601 [Panicum virgatum]
MTTRARCWTPSPRRRRAASGSSSWATATAASASRSPWRGSRARSPPPCSWPRRCPASASTWESPPRSSCEELLLKACSWTAKRWPSTAATAKWSSNPDGSKIHGREVLPGEPRRGPDPGQAAGEAWQPVPGGPGDEGRGAAHGRQLRVGEEGVRGGQGRRLQHRGDAALDGGHEPRHGGGGDRRRRPRRHELQAQGTLRPPAQDSQQIRLEHPSNRRDHGERQEAASAPPLRAGARVRPRRVVLVQGGHRPVIRRPPRHGAGHDRVRRQPRARRGGGVLRGVQPAAAGHGGRAAAGGASGPRRTQLRRAEPRAGHGEVPGQRRRRGLRLGRHARRWEAHDLRPRRGTPLPPSSMVLYLV